MRLAFLSCAALVTGCAAEPAAEPAERPDTAVERPDDRLPDPPKAPPAPPGLPGLLPLTEAQVEAELDSGASCTLTDGGPPLLVAMPGDAIINDRGTIVHLKPDAGDWNGLIQGGAFVGKSVTVVVHPGAEVARYEEVIEYDAGTSVVRGGRGYSVSHGPRWACGA